MKQETKFKVLMFAQNYVDVNRLNEGIYTSNKPFIYSSDETIEAMIGRAKQMEDMAGADFIKDKYFDSLQQCQLVDVSITVLPSELSDSPDR